MEHSAWRILHNEVTVAEIIRVSQAWAVSGVAEQTLYQSIQDAVTNTPAARQLDRPGLWEVKTDLDTMEAFELLDEPCREVSEVLVNGTAFSVLSDERGRFLFHPDYWPPESQQDEEESILRIGLGNPYGIGFAYWVDRLRCMYRLSATEDVAFEDFVPVGYSSDLAAVRDLMRLMRRPVCSVTWSGRESLADEDIEMLISLVCPPYGVVWFDGELWRTGPRPTRFEPTRQVVLPDSHMQLWRETNCGVWEKGSVLDQLEPNVTEPSRPWHAVLVPSELDLATLLAADFTAGEYYNDTYWQALIVGAPGLQIFGLQIYSPELAAVYAYLLGGVLLRGDNKQLTELTVDGTPLRAWDWDPLPVEPPQAANRIRDICDIEKLAQW